MSDTTAATITGFTTDATHFIKIYTASSERHDGKWNTGKYRLEPSGNVNALIMDGNNFVVVDGLQIQIQGATTPHSEIGG